MNLVKLNSVGSLIDIEEKIVYPEMENGLPDLDCGVEFENLDQYWLDQLSGDDIDILRNNEFVIW